ncbi:hypothetical protein HK097_004238 [Rhizophlyctis rosea]|uniref:HNH nuclease domain-containing protein n=1 Tax=Rhizophlyctis rosea TaxID=64517 RepID=A0AAD5X071_9FUNG|nr:hypothetical protein HK097_004238 [Rhizophlyctis rosea]
MTKNPGRGVIHPENFAAKGKNKTGDAEPVDPDAFAGAVEEQIAIETAEAPDYRLKEVLLETMQKHMASECLIRDQVCVVTRTRSALKCAHILRPLYAFDYFNDPLLAISYLAHPNASRNWKCHDPRNGVMLSSTLHDTLEDFDWSFFVRGTKIFTFCFNTATTSNTFLPHLHPVRKPSPLVDEDGFCADPALFQNLFPHEDVFSEHMRQAILRKCRGAGDEKDEMSFRDEEAVEVWEEEDSEIDEEEEVAEEGGSGFETPASNGLLASASTATVYEFDQ